MTGEYSLTCAYCGETVIRRLQGRRHRYCSRSCGRRAQPQTPVADRFWSKVDIRGLFECWEWQAYRKPDGYGQFSIGGRAGREIPASRAAYLLTHGLASLPADIDVCHHCDNPPCCNPSHLFIGTRADNLSDCVSKGRMHLGERHGHAKLTADHVRMIRRQLATGMTCTPIAKQLGVSRGAISGIQRNVNWRHITETA